MVDPECSVRRRLPREAELVEAGRDGKAVPYRLAPGVHAAKGRGVDLRCCALTFPPGR
jgi:hypothetical protein